MWIAASTIRRARYQKSAKGRPLPAIDLVVAEIEVLSLATAERTAEEFSSAIGANVETELLVNILADLRVFAVFESLQNILDLLKVVGVVIRRVFERVERRIDFHLHYVTKVGLGIEPTLTTVARVVNHCVTSSPRIASALERQNHATRTKRHPFQESMAFASGFILMTTDDNWQPKHRIF